jgi:FkbM family methyltransferase
MKMNTIDTLSIMVIENNDCGAFIGMFSLYARQQGASQIIAIEADKERYEYLKQNCNNAPVTPLNR